MTKNFSVLQISSYTLDCHNVGSLCGMLGDNSNFLLFLGLLILVRTLEGDRLSDDICMGNRLAEIEAQRKKKINAQNCSPFVQK